VSASTRLEDIKRLQQDWVERKTTPATVAAIEESVAVTASTPEGRFAKIALPLAQMQVPMTPVRPGTKRAFLPDFPTTATTDIDQILEWDKLYPDCNGACVARAEVGGVWFFEADSVDVIPRMEKDTGQKIPETFRVRSRPGRGHYYFRQTPASMAMGNISQTYVVGGDWSVRTNREYVVGPGSIHPDTQQPYMALNWETPIAEAPDWLVNWLLSQKITKADGKTEAPRNERGLIPRGSIHGFMLTTAGRMRNAGMKQDEIESALLRIVNEQCEGPIDESKVIQMSKSICNFPVGENTPAIAFTQGAVTLVGGTVAEESEDETEEIAPTTSLLLPDGVLASTVLGDLYGDLFQPNGWTMELALPALATVGSVLVPYKEGGIELQTPVVSLYTALIGPVGCGKTQSTEWAAKALGIYNETQAEHYTNFRFGSAEQMWKYLHKHSANQTLRPFRDAVLIDSDEWAHVMTKAGIPDASLPSTLTTAFSKRKHNVTLGGPSGGKDLHIPFAFSMIGGIVENQFESVFSAATVGGLYDRFLFGLTPQDFKWNYREFPFDFQPLQLKPVPVKLDPSVYEVIEVWNLKYPGMGRIVEVCLRIARIFASIDGRDVVTGDDLERLEPLALQQQAIRGLYRPNPGINSDAIFANVVLNWVQTHKGWHTFRDLQRGTNFCRLKLGPSVAFRAIQSLAKDHQIDMWVSTANGVGDLNEMPHDYTGKRPKIGSGLVRLALHN
jgi:hypothetical protein